MNGFVLICGLALIAATLLATGTTHLARLHGFARLLRQHALLPGSLAQLLAVLVTGAELMIGLAALVALLGGDPRLGTAACAGALGIGATFVVYLRRLMRTGHSGSCGCSPLTSPLTPASFVPAASLLVTGAVGLLARWAGAAMLAPRPWSSLAVGWGLTLAALVLLLPATAPGKVAEAGP